jgi:hypothetical protein
MVQVEEHLPSKYEALRSNTSTIKKKKEKERKIFQAQLKPILDLNFCF